MTPRGLSRRASLFLLRLFPILVATVAGLGVLEAQDDVRRFTVVIAEREVVGGGATLSATQGETVELLWRSDEDVEVHLHGYDIEVTVPAGGEAVMTIDARTAGRFPVTSHGFAGDSGRAHRPLLYLEIHPE